MLYRILTRKQRESIRSDARSAWLQSSCDKDEAIAIVTRTLNDKMKGIIGTILLQLAIKLAIELIMRWLEDRNKQPSSFYVADEPGY